MSVYLKISRPGLDYLGMYSMRHNELLGFYSQLFDSSCYCELRTK